jgi:hypothetical protein
MKWIGKLFGLMFLGTTLFLATHFFSWRLSVHRERALGQELNANVCEGELQSYADRLQEDSKRHGLERALFLNKEYSRDCVDNPVHVQFNGENFMVTSAGFDRMEDTADDFSASPRVAH